MMRPLSEKKLELIDELVEDMRRFVPDGDWHLAEPFARRSFAEVAIDELRGVGVRALSLTALSLFQRIRERQPGQLEVALFDTEEEEEDWAHNRTVIEVVSDDMPFLVDSLTGELARRNLTIHLAVHPQIAVRRDAEGRLLELVPLGSALEQGVRLESVMHLQVDQVASAPERVELETAVHKVLVDVSTVVDDWQPMRSSCQQAIDHLADQRGRLDADELHETLNFLRWVVDDHFTFLGYLEYELVVEGGEEYLRPDRNTGLGILRHLPLAEQASSRMPISSDSHRFLESERLVSISKTSQRSTVHRLVHMDMISLKRFGSEGQVEGEVRLVGLFTSMAYSIAARNIPLVRRKVDWVMEHTRFLPTSHDAKVLRHIVENYPRDELFQISESDLYHFSMRILELQLRPRLALLVRHDEEERFVSCMVYVPRDRFDTNRREEIQAILEACFQGEVSTYTTRISERPLAQLHFLVHTRSGGIPPYDLEAIEARMAEAIRSWSDQLKVGLMEELGEKEGVQVWHRYADAFPSSYQQDNDIQQAIVDIPVVESTLADGRLGIRLYRRPGASPDRFHLRTFELAVAKPLSDLLPILENMGLEVIGEFPFEVRPSDAANPVWIRDFEVIYGGGGDISEAGARFADALRHTYLGQVENDGFNRLVLSAGLGWRQVVLLRAFCKYLRQTGIAFSQAYMEQTLARNPGVAERLIQLFDAAFDPERQNGVDREQLILGEIHQALDGVKSLDEDRILRRFLNLVQSTLRTNYYKPGAGEDGSPGEPTPDPTGSERFEDYISFKFDGTKVTGLPSPRPAYEI
ncbi:MAG: NAD-glutamate dehydrogenase, partial [Holophagales bacterium]|nr:NAD-glutamate dehydrogenase [Holophagales bacterium]